MKFPVVGISGLSLGRFKTKWHLGAGPMARHKAYYKGKGGGFPKSGMWWVLWDCVCMWLVCAPKCSNYTLTNLLFGLCRSMWVIELLFNLSKSHPGAPTGPSTPEVLRSKKHAPTPSPFDVHIWTQSWVHLGAWGCVMKDLVKVSYYLGIQILRAKILKTISLD